MASRTSSASGKLSSTSRRLNRCRADGLGVSRDGEEKGCSLSRFGFDPDSSPVALDHPLADREADARSAVFLIAMESLENTKDFLLISWIDTDPVVLDRKTTRRAPIRRRDMDPGLLFPSIL